MAIQERKSGKTSSNTLERHFNVALRLVASFANHLTGILNIPSERIIGDKTCG